MDCLLTIISITKAEVMQERRYLKFSEWFWCTFKCSLLWQFKCFRILAKPDDDELNQTIMMNLLWNERWLEKIYLKCQLGLPYLGQLMKHFNTTCIFQIHLKRSFASTVPPRKNKLTVVTFYLKNAPILWECCDNIKSQLTNCLQKVSIQLNSESVTNLQHYLKQITAVNTSVSNTVTNTNSTWQSVNFTPDWGAAET